MTNSTKFYLIRASIFAGIFLLLLSILTAHYWQYSLFGLDWPAAEWGCVAVLVICACAFICLRWQSARRVISKGSGWGTTLSAFFLTGLIIFGGAVYARNQPEPVATIQFIAVFGGIAVSQALAWLNARMENGRYRGVLRPAVLVSFIVLLTAAAVFPFAEQKDFYYYRQIRWSGIWANPNAYGLMMGTGLVAVFGCLFGEGIYGNVATQNTGWRKFARWWRWIRRCLLLAAAAALGLGLEKSFSRGAWLATMCGMAYLVWSWQRRVDLPVDPAISNHVFSRIKTSVRCCPGLAPTIIVIVLSFGILSFWAFRESDQLLTKRAFSVGNKNDFSWRNRQVTAVGALQMIGATPWSGLGWNQMEKVYDAQYRPPKLTDGKAITLNDYLTWGITLGLPALACLLIYFYLRFRSGHCFSNHNPVPTDDWCRATLRAAALVLLAGFLCESGLFVIPLGVPLWILLELGSADETDAALFHRRSEWLVIGAVVTALAAILYWAHANDRFRRVEFALNITAQKTMNGLAILPMPVQPCPVVVYFHGSGETLLNDGVPLRQFAELGLAAVSLEYDESDPAGFAETFAALSNYLERQTWALSDTTAWIGFNSGARHMLQFLMNQPDQQPRLLIALATDPVSAPDAGVRSGISNSIQCPVLLVHGSKDDIFPIRHLPALVNGLQSHGAAVSTCILPDHGHGLDPDQPVLFRWAGEYCRSVLTPGNPFKGVSASRDISLWVCLLPAGFMALLAGYVTWKRRSINGVSFAPNARVKYLHWLAVLMLLAAIGQTAFHTLVPRLAASETTLRFTQRRLVPARCEQEFTWLSTQPALYGNSLKTFLDYAELANYNRGLVNWKTDDQKYREFVLSPMISSELPAGLGWRRPLWESFYPRIRKVKTPEAAAQLVARYLRERVTIMAGASPAISIEAMWDREIADEKNFQWIYIAALRSIGVAARTDVLGRAELWTGERWTTAPQPVISLPAL